MVRAVRGKEGRKKRGSNGAAKGQSATADGQQYEDEEVEEVDEYHTFAPQRNKENVPNTSISMMSPERQMGISSAGNVETPLQLLSTMSSGMPSSGGFLDIGFDFGEDDNKMDSKHKRRRHGGAATPRSVIKGGSGRGGRGAHIGEEIAGGGANDGISSVARAAADLAMQATPHVREGTQVHFSSACSAMYEFSPGNSGLSGGREVLSANLGGLGYSPFPTPYNLRCTPSRGGGGFGGMGRLTPAPTSAAKFAAGADLTNIFASGGEGGVLKGSPGRFGYSPALSDISVSGLFGGAGKGAEEQEEKEKEKETEKEKVRSRSRSRNRGSVARASEHADRSRQSAPPLSRPSPSPRAPLTPTSLAQVVEKAAKSEEDLMSPGDLAASRLSTITEKREEDLSMSQMSQSTGPGGFAVTTTSFAASGSSAWGGLRNGVGFMVAGGVVGGGNATPAMLPMSPMGFMSSVKPSMRRKSMRLDINDLLSPGTEEEGEEGAAKLAERGAARGAAGDGFGVVSMGKGGESWI